MTKLIFIYNANAGKVSAIIDSFHKILSPSTYQCHLCAITFGNFSEDKIWKAFRVQSKTEMKFYHKDEFLKEFRSKWLPKFDFPIVLSEEKGELAVFITSKELIKLENASQLISEIKKRQSDC